MFLIVGLGNPGEKYEKTRHNIGFKAVDEIAANFQFSISNFQSISNAQISKGKIAEKEVVLAKPQSFMNNSGKAVKSLYTKYLPGRQAGKIQNTKYLFVIHDDLDLPLGEIKIVRNRGSAGHKGVQSIIDALGTKDFIRFRIGISPKSLPCRQAGEIRSTKSETFVLQKFTKDEEKIVKGVIEKIKEAVELSLKEGLEKAMNLYNER